MTFFKVLEIVSAIIVAVNIVLFAKALGVASIVPIAFMIPYIIIGLIGLTIRKKNSSLGNRTIGAGVEISSILANLFYLFVAINAYSLRDQESSYAFLTFLILWASTAILILIVSYIIGYVKEKNEISTTKTGSN